MKFVIAFIALVCLAGCGPESESGSEAEVVGSAMGTDNPSAGVSRSATNTALTSATLLWEGQCQVCHLSLSEGRLDGRSAGEIARALLHEPAMRHISLTDDEVSLLGQLLSGELGADKSNNSSDNSGSETFQTEFNTATASPVTTDAGNSMNGNQYAALLAEIQTLMQSPEVNCTNGCHGQIPGLSRVNLLTGTMADLADRLVGQTASSARCSDELLIDPDNPDNSLLLRLIDSKISQTLCMSKMPLGANGIPRPGYEKFSEWVQALITVKASQNTGASTPGETPPPAFVDEGVRGEAFSVLNRAKFMAHGGAVTTEELERVTDSGGKVKSDALRAVVDDWMGTEDYRRKRRAFLRLFLQQNPSDENYTIQLGRTNGLNGLRSNLADSFLRTAERIIDNDEDFRTLLTTREWEVTSAMLVALKRAEAPASNALNRDLIQEAFGVRAPSKAGFTALYNQTTDTQDWRTVTLVSHPDTPLWSNYGDYFDAGKAQAVRDLPDGGSFALRLPRIGFFTSPAFFQKWETNVDNQFRVSVNQAMIVALGLTFETGDDTPVNNDLAGLNAEHAPRGSECFGCHQHLDPMRNMYMKYFSSISLRPIADGDSKPKPDFAFHGHSVSVNTIEEWADALASHPYFAMGWTLKLCQWASSTRCDKTDPRVQVLAANFEASGYRFNTLMRDFLSSSLMTTTSFYEETVQPGAQVSIARKEHFCAALTARMSAIRRARGLPVTQNTTDLCSLGTTRQSANAIPQDLMVRATVEPTLPVGNEPFLSTNFGNICQLAANTVVRSSDADSIDSRNVTQTLDLLVSELLGFSPGTERYDQARSVYESIYEVQIAKPACASSADVEVALTQSTPSCGLVLGRTSALRNVFTMICQSPSLTGVGL